MFVDVHLVLASAKLFLIARTFMVTFTFRPLQTDGWILIATPAFIAVLETREDESLHLAGDHALAWAIFTITVDIPWQKTIFVIKAAQVDRLSEDTPVAKFMLKVTVADIIEVHSGS
jgi:hypothetical protein